ncbi:MAG: hypothetical protein ACLR6J_13035 [Parabacteroides merdae]
MTGWTTLKIRSGYGVTGNNDFSDDLHGQYIVGHEPDDAERNMERTHTVNRKMSILIWDGKKRRSGTWVSITLSSKDACMASLDYYRRECDNLPSSCEGPANHLIRRACQVQNIGSMESKGWEFEVGGDIIRTKDFTWSSSMNLSHNTGKILTLEGDNSYHNAVMVSRLRELRAMQPVWKPVRQSVLSICGSSQGSMTRAVSCCITRMAR